MFDSVRAVLSLGRVEHGVAYALAVALAACLSHCTFSLGHVLLGMAVAFLIQFGAFVHNDLVDVEVDRINHRPRPLATGQLNTKFAYLLLSLSWSSAFLLSLFLPPVLLVVNVVLMALSLVYNSYLKRLPVLGNAFIAFTMALPFLYGNLLLCPAINVKNAALFVSALLLGLGREIVKDVEDVKGDRAVGMWTLPVIVGEMMSFALGFAFMAMAFIPLLFIHPFFLYLFPVYVVGLMYYSVRWKLGDKRAIRGLRSFTLFSVFVVILLTFVL